MSQFQRAPGGGGPGGSVKRARERMEAGLPPERPQSPPRQHVMAAFDVPRPAPAPPRNQQPLKSAMASPDKDRGGQGGIGVAISRPTPAAQWPLTSSSDSNTTDKFVGDRDYQPPPGKSSPPQRPPRPSHVPSILDASRPQSHTPAFPYIPQQRGQNLKSPAQRPPRPEESTSSPIISPSSRPSTLSSVGTIPDFPVPMAASQFLQPVPPRRSANLGPPPTARRGASSYYSQISYVSPIPEESPRTQRSHGSYASSAAIPSSWGSESPGSYGDEELSPGYATFSDDEFLEDGRESRASRSDDGDESGLVRKASVGRKGKPSLISTRSSERMEAPILAAEPMPTTSKAGIEGLTNMRAAIAGAVAGAAATEVLSAEQRHEGKQTAPPLERPSTSSSETVPTLSANRPSMPRMASTGISRHDSATIGQLEGSEDLRPPEPRFSRLSAIRRPPKLNIDAVRQAEARGSLTSLPDLIRRATRLAALMDKGRRPGSRLNDLNDFPSDIDLAREKELMGKPHPQSCQMHTNSHTEDRRRSGLSDMLAAFPPPGLATPTRNQSPAPRGPRPVSTWPAFADSGSVNEPSGEKSKKARKCCGVSVCCFVVCLIIALIVIAAAVIVPVELLVVHKKTATTSAASANTSIAACQASLTCQNGGTNTISSGVCSCICTNGFTGSTCQTSGSLGCTTANFTGYSNATLGDAIPRLINQAQTNFSIPLFATTILARFNTGNLSCTSENALVTFDGEDERTGDATAVVSSSASTTTAVAKRDGGFFVTNSFSGASSYATATTSSSQTTISSSTSTTSHSIATSNGIIFDPTPTTTTKSSSTASTVASTATFTTTEESLDFARVAVLFVLQQDSLDSAVTAQTQLQKFFSTDSTTNSAASNFSIGSDITVNMVSFSLDLGNGTVGGTGQTLSSKRSKVLYA
jgi:hypothetical protein